MSSRRTTRSSAAASNSENADNAPKTPSHRVLRHRESPFGGSSSLRTPGAVPLDDVAAGSSSSVRRPRSRRVRNTEESGMMEDHVPDADDPVPLIPSLDTHAHADADVNMHEFLTRDPPPGAQPQVAEDEPPQNGGAPFAGLYYNVYVVFQHRLITACQTTLEASRGPIDFFKSTPALLMSTLSKVPDYLPIDQLVAIKWSAILRFMLLTMALVFGMSVAIIFFSNDQPTPQYSSHPAPVSTPVDLESLMTKLPDSVMNKLRKIAENEVKQQTQGLIMTLEAQSVLLKDALLNRISQVQEVTEKEAKELRDRLINANQEANVLRASIEALQGDLKNKILASVSASQPSNQTSPSVADDSLRKELQLLDERLRSLLSDQKAEYTRLQSELEKKLDPSALSEKVKPGLIENLQPLVSTATNALKRDVDLLLKEKDSFKEQLSKEKDSLKELIEQEVSKLRESHATLLHQMQTLSPVGTGTSAEGKGIQSEDGQMAVSHIGEDIEKKVRDIVKAEIEAFDADGNNLADFALSSIGAFVSIPYTSHSYVPDLNYQLDGLPGLPSASSAPLKVRVEKGLKLPWMYLSAVVKWSYDKLRSVVRRDTSFSRGPAAVLEKDLSLGQCWAFKGSKGHVTIGLGAPVYIDSFTVDHVPRGLRISGDSAPKNLTLWGLGRHPNQKGLRLGEGQYDIYGPTRQTFRVQSSEASTGPHSYVRFEIDSNHGNNRYTCVYRLRVHGKPSVKKETSPGHHT